MMNKHEEMQKYFAALFNTGVEVFSSGSATATIEYLESLKDQERNNERLPRF